MYQKKVKKIHTHTAIISFFVPNLANYIHILPLCHFDLKKMKQAKLTFCQKIVINARERERRHIICSSISPHQSFTNAQKIDKNQELFKKTKLVNYG